MSHAVRAAPLGDLLAFLAAAPPVRPLLVELPYPEPPLAEAYRQILGCRLEFGAPRAAVTLDLSDLLEARPAPEPDVAARVRGIIRASFGGPIPGAAAIADRLAMSPQTLRRRLAAVGTTSSRLRDQVLAELAIAELRGGASVAAVAERLGFSGPATFHRAFKRWTGATPASYRR